MINYTSFYDRVFICLHNSSVRLIRHFFLIPLRWRIRQILLYKAHLNCGYSLKHHTVRPTKNDHFLGLQTVTTFEWCPVIVVDNLSPGTNEYLFEASPNACSGSATVLSSQFLIKVLNLATNHRHQTLSWATFVTKYHLHWNVTNGFNDLVTKGLEQWFSTFSLKGAKYSRMTLFESRTKDILTQVKWHVLLYCRTTSVTQNIRGITAILLRVAQRVLGSRMWWLSKQWLRTTGLANEDTTHLVKKLVFTKLLSSKSWEVSRSNFHLNFKYCLRIKKTLFQPLLAHTRYTRCDP